MKKTMMQAFEWYINREDKHYVRLTQQLHELSDLGINQVWLPPAYKGHRGDFDSGYGVYDLYDLGEFDQKGSISTKYGSYEEYMLLIEGLKDFGIDIIVDVVLNHRIGADMTEVVRAREVDFNNRFLEKRLREIEAWTRFDFPGRNGKYSEFKWNKDHFKAIDYDARLDLNGIYLFEGKRWDMLVDDENFNYDYLMGADVDFNHIEVQQELLNWMHWYYDLVGFNGVRLDAVKHIDAKFFKEALTMLRELDPEIYAVGEYWSGDLKVLHDYLMDVDFSMQLFDVPLHFNLYHASLNDTYDLRTLYNGTLAMSNPNYAVTFVDNHDTQLGQSLESWVLDWFKLHAYAFILLRDVGIPSVFYPDLYGSNHDKMQKVKYLDKLLLLRKGHMHGSFYDYMDESNLIGWCFTGNEVREGFAVVLNTGGRTVKRMFVGMFNANKTFVDCISGRRIGIDEDGIGYFPVDDKQVAIYVNVEGEYDEGIL